jgi:hypothetical protein
VNGLPRRLALRLSLRPRLPSGGWRDPGRRRRLFALLAVRDDAAYLPGWFESVLPEVDGVVALDDGSTDASAELLAARPEVRELLRVPRERPGWDEPGNFRALVAAAARQGADWMLAVDADERLERGFRARFERVARRGARLGLTAFAVRILDCWEGRDRYRVDGPWGAKSAPRLFRAPGAGARFDDRPLHAAKAPLDGRVGGRFVVADLRVYHLRMISAEARAARRARYEGLDPDHRWQSVGYGHLTDERGLRLRRVPARRGFAG